MKKKKLNLDELKVKSFVTSLNDGHKRTINIKGGGLSNDPAECMSLGGPNTACDTYQPLCIHTQQPESQCSGCDACDYDTSGAGRCFSDVGWFCETNPGVCN